MRTTRFMDVIAGVLVAVGLSLAPTASHAIPEYVAAVNAAWQVNYVGCTTCHYDGVQNMTVVGYGVTFAAVPTHQTNPQGAALIAGRPPGCCTTTGPSTTTTTGTTTSTTVPSGSTTMGSTTSTTGIIMTTTGSTTTTTLFPAACSSCHDIPVGKPNTAYYFPDVNYCSATFPPKLASMAALGGMTAAQLEWILTGRCVGGSTTAAWTTTTGLTTTTTASSTTTTMASSGAALYGSYCASCHDGAAAAGGGRNVLGARICSIDGALNGTQVFIGGVPSMQFLKGMLSAEQIRLISNYLNVGLVTGQQRYITACAGCHGADARGGRVGEGVRGSNPGEIRGAIREGEGGMGVIRCLPATDINEISSYLRGKVATTRPSTTTTSSTTTTHRRH